MVTPCVGVWIETSLYVNRSIDSSHTLRGCVDWNFFEQIGHIPTSVTPCVGVWIETPVPDFPNFCLCHTLRGCVDWNRNVIEFTDINYSHTLRGCVDWNTIITGITFFNSRHTLRGCVDWNIHTKTESKPATPVTPCVGVWIETDGLSVFITYNESHPAWVCGLKPDWTAGNSARWCHTLRGCVDWNTILLY